MHFKSRSTAGIWLSRFTFLCAAQLFSTFTHADVDLMFGVYTTDQPTEMVKSYRPILNGIEAELARRLGDKVNIELKIASNYEKGVQNIVLGNVDFAMIGAAPYVRARKQNPFLKLLALESKNDSKTFNGVIAVSAYSPIDSVEQLAGKTFAFGDKSSTIGRYISQAFLLENGIGADDLSHYAYLGRHDRVGHAVATGQYDAGALKEGTFKKLVRRGAKIRAIAKFPTVNKAWVASSELSDSIYRELQQVMLGLNDESLFKPFSRKRFVAGLDEDYDGISDAMDKNQRFFSGSNLNTTMVLVEED